MGKRANGEGNITQRKDGRWIGRLTLGKDSAGKRIRKVVYGKTQADAVSKLEDLRQQARMSVKAVTSKDKLVGYLQRWLNNDVALNKAGKTLQDYEGTARRYITPFIGHVKLSRLDGERLEEWQTELHRAGHTVSTRARSIRILRAALNRAVKLKMIVSNPCRSLTMPKESKTEVIPLEPEQCHTLFDKCDDHRIGDVITLAAMTGLRKGELFALEWSAVNLHEGVLAVRQTLQEISGRLSVKEPKQDSRRVVTLEDIALKALRSRKEKAIAEGFTPDEVSLVFPDTRGGFLRSSNFDRNVWYPIRDAAELPDTVKFHDLRHTQASLMLNAGVDMKVIQRRLGHAKYETTANIYAHLMPGAQAEATDKMAALMEQTRPKKKRARTAR